MSNVVKTHALFSLIALNHDTTSAVLFHCWTFSFCLSVALILSRRRLLTSPSSGPLWRGLISLPSTLLRKLSLWSSSEGYKRLPAIQHVHLICNLEVCSDHLSLRFAVDVVIRCFRGMLVIFSDVLLQQPSALVFFHSIQVSGLVRWHEDFIWFPDLCNVGSHFLLDVIFDFPELQTSDEIEHVGHEGFHFVSNCGGDFRFFRPYFSPCASASFSLSCSSPRRRKKNSFRLILLITRSTTSMSFFWQVSTAGIGMFFQEYGKSNFRSVAMSVLVPFLFRSYSVLARSRCRNVSSWYRSCKSRIGPKESAQLKGAKLSNYKDESGCPQKSAQPANAGGGCVVFAKMPLYFFHGAKKIKNDQKLKSSRWVLPY